MRVEESEDRSVTGEIDLAHLGRTLLAKRWWVIGPTLAALVGALVFVTVVKPRYTSEARVLLENQESFLPRADKTESRGTEAAPDPEAVQTQANLLESRDLARRALKALQLQGNDEFDPLAKGVPLSMRPLLMLGLAKDPTLVSPEERILDSFLDRRKIIPPPKTRVLSIEFSSRDPDTAARGANALADAYIEYRQEAKRDEARQAAKSLAALVAELRTRVAESEARAEEFRAKSGLFIGSNNTTINAQHLSDLNTQLSLSRSAQADARAKAQILKDMLKQRRIGDIPDVANNEVMRKLQEQRVTLRAQLALESRTLLPGHPRIKELDAQLADLDRQSRAAAERVVRTLENDARIAGARVENLTQALDEQKKIVGSADADDVKLRELERSARLYKEQLESATAKYQEALARENSQATPADARIFQRALAPQNPSFPMKIPIFSGVGFAASFLSIVTILAGELLSGRARMASEPRVGAEVPASASAPMTRSPLNDAESKAPDLAPSVEALKTLGPDVETEPEKILDDAAIGKFETKADAAPSPFARLARKAMQRWREAAPPSSEVELIEPSTPKSEPTLTSNEEKDRIRRDASEPAFSVTSSLADDADTQFRSDEGVLSSIDVGRRSGPCVKVLVVRGDRSPASFATVVALARSLARRGRAVLVAADRADTDFDRLVPTERETPLGLHDLTSGLADFADVIHRDRETRLHIVPTGEGGGDSAPLYSLGEVVDALAHTYDFVVVSTGTAENALGLGAMFNKILLRGAVPIEPKLLEALCGVCQDVSLVQDAESDQAAA